MSYFCNNCCIIVRRLGNVDGKILCVDCGCVLDEDVYSEEPTFIKDAHGQARVAANRVNIESDDYSASRKRTLEDAQHGIESIIETLHIGGGDSLTSAALRLYEIALDRNFTKGRRKDRVEAACLYIICRVKGKPYLLIDFSEHLRISVYGLGRVFFELCQLLSLVEHPICTKPVDPSLFMERFTGKLFELKQFSSTQRDFVTVTENAVRILACMKRDWMQTGRKPSGLCGAALYASVLSHGLECSKSDIIKVVHIGIDTLTKRLIEFEDTESGNLTMVKLNEKAEELKNKNKEMLTKPIHSGAKASNELLCKHKDKEGVPHFSCRLCENCYKEFVELSGGLDSFSDPPAFRRAEMLRAKAKEGSPQTPDNIDSIFPDQAEKDSEVLHDITHDSTDDRIHEADDTFEESETLSDIDDTEVECYLHNEEEKKLKKIIWEETNKEFIEEQAAKDAAAEAAKKAYEAQFTNCSEDFLEAQKLAATTTANVENSNKQRKRAAERKNFGPAQTALEATMQMLGKKRLSSKINYDVLEELYTESEILETRKKSKVDDPICDYDYEDPEMESVEDAYFDSGDEYQFDEDNSLDAL